MARSAQFVQAFVELAHAAADDDERADVAGMVTDRCIELFDAAEAGIVLALPGEPARPVAISRTDDGGSEVGALERRHGQGPGFDAHRSGAIVYCIDSADARRRWPRFAPEAERAGIRAFTAVPMRRGGRAIGALNLFSAAVARPALDDLPIVQALADVASLAVVSDSVDRDALLLAAQLQTALDTRVVIEQAKGVVAERTGVAIDDAFAAMRSYARGRRQLLTDVARRIVGGELDPGALVPRAHGSRHTPITGRSGTPRGAR